VHPWDFKFRLRTTSSICEIHSHLIAALARDNFPATTTPAPTDERTCRLNSSTQHGPFLVTTLPALDTQALANDIVARIERDFARATPNRSSATYVPISFFEPRRDTPAIVLRRVLKSLYSFAFSA